MSFILIGFLLKDINVGSISNISGNEFPFFLMQLKRIKDFKGYQG